MRLFLANFESNSFIEGFEEKPLFVLGSFHYLRKMNIEFLEQYFNYVKNCKGFILDSGAFSFLNAKDGLNKFLDNLDLYVSDYIDFINKYDIEHFVELDIDGLVGYEKVVEIRNKIEKGTNKKTIPVWHLSRGLDEFIKHTKEYDYIAIGGIVTKEIKKKDYPKLFPKLLKIAKKNNCKVHGLGFTSNEIQKYKFYSVDSTSWLSCSRYSRFMRFNHKLKIMQGFVISKEYRLNLKGENLKKLLKISVKEWIKYQKYLQNTR